MHVHVHTQTGEAKFWMEPRIEIALNFNLSDHEITLARKLIEQHEKEIRNAWSRHFAS